MTRLLLPALCALALPAQNWLAVRPILAQRCQGCHQGSAAPAGLSLVDATTVQRSARRILDAVASGRMPKAGAALKPLEIEAIRQWANAETWWSLRPLPFAASPGSIDGFIRSELAKRRLTPSPAADRRTLIRRVTFDLHGLPPSTGEVKTFVEDRSPDAYARLVDRLLASPRYGERWARHWFDVIHYGESHGYDKDKPRLNAWPYRDWLIAAFNNDKPYARFVEEQIGGDVIYPEDPQATVATGFLAAGPWDFVGHQELKEGTSDKELTRVLDRDDVVAQTMSTFVSTTAHCARCHDHKFDPIPQVDYYRLQAVFAGVDRADRPFDDDPALYGRRRALLERKRAAQLELQPLLDKIEFATSAELVEVDNRIRDASLLITHIGEPKTAAVAAEKTMLQARRVKDTGLRQSLLDGVTGTAIHGEIAAARGRLKVIDAEIAALPAPRYVYAASSFFERAGNFRPPLEPRPIHLLKRGSVTAPGELMRPGALSAVPGSGAGFDARTEGAGRKGLAQWITAQENMLTWRSAVNRAWHFHFGAGLVDTPNDFGRMGGQPSHPELLDWLAVWFRDEAKGSLKKLHRLILLSEAYQQSSASRPEPLKVDADNRLLWRMNRGRLDAESVHDAALAVAGQLDLTMGGPSVQMFWFKNDHSPIYDYARFDPAAPGANRRSVYRFLVRSVADPFFDRLDCPDPSVLTPKRSTTLTAIQALALWNNPFMLRMSEQLAARATSVAEMAELVWQRPPTAAELTPLTNYAAKHGKPSLARLLFNTNEFLFVD